MKPFVRDDGTIVVVDMTPEECAAAFAALRAELHARGAARSMRAAEARQRRAFHKRYCAFWKCRECGGHCGMSIGAPVRCFHCPATELYLAGYTWSLALRSIATDAENAARDGEADR